LEEPLPWWIGPLMTAEKFHCPPWELYPYPTSKTFWMTASQILGAAQHEIDEIVRARNKS